MESLRQGQGCLLNRAYYVLFKKSRHYTGGLGYQGSSCQRAGVAPGRVYTDFAQAEADRDKLNQVNGAGFVVLPYQQPTF